jgi:TPR repeat protein
MYKTFVINILKQVPKNEIQAYLLFEMGANMGDTQAQNNLGYMYEHGKFVKQDYQEAVKWYSKASEQGSGVGKRNLGLLYYHGLGVEQDRKKGIELLHGALESGEVNDALQILGRMYIENEEEQKGI